MKTKRAQRKLKNPPNEEGFSWSEANAEELARGLLAHEAVIPPEELESWLWAVERVVRPLEETDGEK